jgi:quinoprotein glucose dehydrogenase
VPQPGEFGHDTWESDSCHRSGANVWAFMTVDARRGILYMPIGAPTYDRWGGDRKGANLFSSSIVAVDAYRRYLWHFQTVHHDVWDFDTQAPPMLVDVKQGRRTLPAVLIVEDRDVACSIESRRTHTPDRRTTCAASDVVGEQTWPTTVSVKPPRLHASRFRWMTLPR